LLFGKAQLTESIENEDLTHVVVKDKESQRIGEIRSLLSRSFHFYDRDFLLMEIGGNPGSLGLLHWNGFLIV
jgi:hypothetical protein